MASAGGSEPLFKLVDFSTHLSGPLASHLLHELGAEVLKIENVHDGDGNRGMDPKIDGRGMFHVSLGGGARSLAISKRSPHWPEVVQAAVEWADAVMVGGRPEDVAKLGLAYEDLAKHNERLVYCLISGYGEAGPWRSYPAHGQQPDALAGLLPVDWIDGLPETPPRWRSTCTTLAGTMAALGVMAGLRRAEREERPQYVHASLWGAAVWWNWRDLNTYASLGEGWPDYRVMGSRYAMYPTADDRAILLCPIERKFWESTCEMLDLPDELRERGDWERSRMDFGLGPVYDGEREAIAAAMRKRPLEEWVAELEQRGIPFAPILTWTEAMESEHAAANGVMRETTTVAGNKAMVAAPPVRVRSGVDIDRAEQQWPPMPPAPELGADTVAVLEELGLADAAAAVEDGRLK
jgi:crotonobetainyl-CoA:carnitine CoA-transferase CaiB-like acyl-CoA transferase